MNIKIEIDLSDLDFDIEKVENAVERELAKTGYKIEATAKELCPVDTGVLRGGIICKPNGLEVDIFTSGGRDYAHYMEYGTSPHMVGDMKHPGTKPYLYMTTAFEVHTEDLEENIAQIIKEVL